jgi:Na+/proline symporter
MTAWGSLPGAYSFAWVLLPTLGIMCQPQVLTRMMMLRDPRDMPKLSIYATCTNMVAGMMVMAIGYCAIYLVANGTVMITDPDKAVFKVADYPGLVAQLFVYPAVLAAALSTSSLFLSLAGNIVSRDLPSSLGFTIRSTRQMTVSRIAMSVMGISAIGFASLSGDMVLLWKGASSKGVMLGMLTALVSTIAGVTIEILKRFDLSNFTWPGGVPWYVFVMAAAVVVTIFASLATAGDDLDRRVEMAMEL